MRFRALALLLLLAAIVGVPWYLLRNPREQQIREWREASRFFFRELGDLSRAEELNDEILKLVPDSLYDILWRAILLEGKSTRDDLEEALALYDDIQSRTSGPVSLLIRLSRARVLRGLGRLEESLGAAHSVMDAYPFEASMELGTTALTSVSPREALKHFEAARDRWATNPVQEAWAWEAIADAHSLEAAITSLSLLPGSDGDSGSQTARESAAESRRRRIEEAERSARLALDQALDKLQSIPKTHSFRREVGIQVARLAYQRSSLGRAASDETPCLDAALSISEMLGLEEGRSSSLPADLASSLGILYLTAAYEELDPGAGPGGGEESPRAEDLLQRAEKLFLAALDSRSVESGRELLATAPLETGSQADGTELARLAESLSVKAWRQYVKGLVYVSAAYLASPGYGKILEDTSPLALSRRVRDAQQAADPDVARIFRLVHSLALIRAGEVAAGVEGLNQHLASLPLQERAGAALEVAEQSLRLFPGDELVFQLLERADEQGSPRLELLVRRIRILLKARKQPKLAEEATRRLDQYLANADGLVREPEQRLVLSRLYRSLGRADASIRALRAGLERHPDHDGIRLTLARTLEERAASLELRTARKEAASAAELNALEREALSHYLGFFVEQPALGSSSIPRMLRLFLRLEQRSADSLDELARLLESRFPGSQPGDLRTFAEALRAFLFQRHAAAIQQARSIENAAPFQPVLSFLVGSSLVELASALSRPAAGEDAGVNEREAERKQREYLATAREEFQKYPLFVPNQLELLSLELESLDRAADVPEELLGRIDDIRHSGEVEHQGHWLLARGLYHRLRLALTGPTWDRDKALRTHGQLQAALRDTIQSNPRFTVAYLALAESWTLEEPLDVPDFTSRGADQDSAMFLFRPEYEKAIRILTSVPEPDARTVERLATCLEGARDLAPARHYRELLTLCAPSASRLAELVQSYLATRDDEALEILLLEERPGGQEPSLTSAQRELVARIRSELEEDRPVGEERLRALLRLLPPSRAAGASPGLRAAWLRLLRQRLGELKDFEGLRNMFAAQYYTSRLERVASSALREDLREQVIQRYERALDHYASSAAPPPLALLNNFAWTLIESSDAESRQRGLDLATQAIGRLPARGSAPGIWDTYACALHRTGRLEEAETEFRKLLAAEERPSYRYHLARLLFETDQLGEALQEVKRALNLSSDFDDRDAVIALRTKIEAARRERMGSSGANEDATPRQGR